MTLPSPHQVVMALYINARGLAFIVFEGAHKPIGWSVVEARWSDNRRRKILARVNSLFAQYKPNVVVLQNMSHTGTHRPHSIRRINEAIVETAKGYTLPVIFFSRTEVRRTFAYLGSVTKDTIAAAIAKRIPAIEYFLPRPRKPWESEDARMGIFDAAALALTFFNASGTAC